VIRFSEEIADFLVRQNVKAILVACNTSSSHALDALRARHEIPVLGVIEPAARVAVERSPHGEIGVVGTLGTVSSGAYAKAIAARAPSAHVVSRACPLFVPLIEEGWIASPITRQVAEEYLRELKAAPLESLILGCTHYPLIAPLLGEVMGPGVRLIDSGAEAVRALAELLAQRGQLAAGPAAHRFYLSDAPPQFASLAQSFLGTELPPMTIVDLSERPVETASRPPAGRA
jgi:glutamate racemase